MFLGEFAALVTAVCWSLTAVFFSYSGRLIGSDVVNRSRLIFALFFLAITHLLVEGTIFPWGAEPFRWFWLAISAILGLVLGDTFLFRAYVLIGPRLSMLLMATAPIYSVIFGWLLFGETVSGMEMTGIFFAVAGVGWVVTERRSGQTAVQEKNYRSGILLGLAGALGQVANLITARYGLVGDYSSLSAAIIRIFVAVLILWFITALRGQIRHTFQLWRNRKAFRAMLGGSFTGPFLGIWFSLIAIQYARLGIAATLMALPPIILIPIEYIVYKRKVSTRGILGTLVAITGVALILLS
ncbi:MAG: DMT family transporter [Candidatus Promineifilaceae bacterium]|nr:DMT family transporter [Candidatus Promineifilaceae bacterium]